MDKTNLPPIRPTGGPLPHDNPLHDFYLPEFKRIFRDLFTVRYVERDYELGLINGTMENLFRRYKDPEERARWEQIVRAAYRYLREDAHKGFRETCEAYVRIVDLIPHALNECVALRHTAESLPAGDDRARAFLSLYKTMCEGPLTLIAAPVIVGFRHVYGVKDGRYFPKPDGRVNLGALDDIENWMDSPSNLLKEGLNRHVRNVYAHQRFKLLDDDRVEMWDQYANGKLSWGPEVWPHARVEALCRQLYLTCLAIESALSIFGLNYSELIKDRGWVPQDRAQPTLRFQQVYDILGHVASAMSMVRTNLTLEDKTLRAELTTCPRGTDHIERKTMDDQGPFPVYEKYVRYIPAPVGFIAAQFLSAASGYADDADVFVASIKGHDGEPLGELHMERAAFDNPTTTADPIADATNVRALAKLDTLGSATMWIVQPLPVTPVRPT